MLTLQYSSSSPKRPPISTSSSSSFSCFTSATGAAAPPPPADGELAAALKKALAYGNSYPLIAETAMRFLNPLRIECGADETVGTPISSAMAVWKPTALLNLLRITSLERSRTAASKMLSF